MKLPRKQTTTAEPLYFQEATTAVPSIPSPDYVGYRESGHDSSTPTAGPSFRPTPDSGSQPCNGVSQSGDWRDHDSQAFQQTVDTGRVDSQSQAFVEAPANQLFLLPSTPVNPSLEFVDSNYPYQALSPPTDNFLVQPETGGLHGGTFGLPCTGGPPREDSGLLLHDPGMRIEPYGAGYPLLSDVLSHNLVVLELITDPSPLPPTTSHITSESAYSGSLTSGPTTMEELCTEPVIEQGSAVYHNADPPAYVFSLFAPPDLNGPATFPDHPFPPTTSDGIFNNSTQAPPHELSEVHSPSDPSTPVTHQLSPSIQQQPIRPDRQQLLPGRSNHHGNAPSAQYSGVAKNRSEHQQCNAVLAVKKSFWTSACVRCSLSRKKCLPYKNGTICSRCHKQNYSMSNLPCVFFQIPEIHLFRRKTAHIANKSYRMLAMDSHVENYSANILVSEDDTHRFVITQNSKALLPLKAIRFDVAIMAKITGKLMNGLDSHPFQLLNLKAAREDIKKFITSNMGSYIKDKVCRQDEISWCIFKTVCEKIKRKLRHHEFLTEVLQLWVAARTIEGGWKIRGPEFLGLIPDDQGIVRLGNASFIDYQFSAILVQDVLGPLSQSVLRQLKSLTHENKKANWLTLFLANFILLHSYGLLMKQQRDFARSRNASVRYPMMTLIREIHYGAKTLLYHFHYICMGQYPFQVDWEHKCMPKSIQKMAELSDQDIQFMRIISQLSKKEVSRFSNLMKTDEYEADHWFTGQLFVTRWEPPETIG